MTSGEVRGADEGDDAGSQPAPRPPRLPSPPPPACADLRRMADELGARIREHLERLRR